MAPFWQAAALLSSASFITGSLECGRVPGPTANGQHHGEQYGRDDDNGRPEENALAARFSACRRGPGRQVFNGLPFLGSIFPVRRSLPGSEGRTPARDPLPLESGLARPLALSLRGPGRAFYYEHTHCVFSTYFSGKTCFGVAGQDFASASREMRIIFSRGRRPG